MTASVADDASQPMHVSMTPPPGIRLPEYALPAKVPVHDEDDTALVQTIASGQPGVGGEWVKTVMQVLPYLNREQLRRALGILDQAFENTQQAKAFQTIDQGEYASTMTMMVTEQQRALLGELSSLGAMGLAAYSNWQPEACVVPGPPGLFMERCEAGLLATPQEMEDDADGMRGAGGAGRPVKTLSTSLQLLSNEDPSCLFIVRRINKLGFKAERKLKQHFSMFGNVVKVLVAHSTVRGDARMNGPARTRRRPSSLGFVQMTSAAAVQQVLQLGTEQEVEGWPIRVQRFERMHGDAAVGMEEEEEEKGEEGHRVAEGKESSDLEDSLERQQSARSTTFTPSTTAGSEDSDQYQ